MDDVKKVVQLRMYEKALRKGKASAQRCTEMEVLTQEATTSEEPWGPHDRKMLEIAKAAEENRDNVPLIMSVIYRCLKERDTEWRPCYKALLLSEYLTKKGPKEMVSEMEFTLPHFQALEKFEFVDTANRDQGAHVREQASAIVQLLSNKDQLSEERHKARFSGQRRYSGFAPGEELARSSLNRSCIHESAPGTPNKADLKSPPNEDALYKAARRGIEQLRARNAALDASSHTCVAFNKKGPRRLSEVKVDPAIATALEGVSAKQRSTSTACYRDPGPPSNGTPSADLLFWNLGNGHASSTPSATPAQPQVHQQAPFQLQPADASALRSAAVCIPRAQPAAPATGDDEWSQILGSAPAAPSMAGRDNEGEDLLSDPFAMLSMQEARPNQLEQGDRKGSANSFTFADQLKGSAPVSVTPSATLSTPLQDQDQPTSEPLPQDMFAEDDWSDMLGSTPLEPTPGMSKTENFTDMLK